MSEFIFNEQSLKQDIEKVWGRCGAHAEVYRDLLLRIERQRNYITDISPEIPKLTISMNLEKVFEKHSDSILKAIHDRDMLDSEMSEPMLTFDQFTAAIAELTPPLPASVEDAAEQYSRNVTVGQGEKGRQSAKMDFIEGWKAREPEIEAVKAERDELKKDLAKNQLEVLVERGALQIRIGVDILAYAASYLGHNVINTKTFAQDVANELTLESSGRDRATPIECLIDNMIVKAVDNGSLGVE